MEWEDSMAYSGFRDRSGEGRAEANNTVEKRAARKSRKVIKSARQPLIPLLCRILFVCMIAFTAADMVMEIAGRMKQAHPAPLKQFAVTLSWSALVTWGFFALLLVVMADIMLIRTVRSGYQDRKYYFKDEIPEDEPLSAYEQEEQPEIDPVKDADLILYSRPEKYDTRMKYLRYVLIAGGGALLLALIYGICLRIAV